MSEITGTCVYCGQTKMVDAKTQDDADRIATQECTCDNPTKKAHQCHENIEQICGESSADYGMELVVEEVIDVIKDAGTMCTNGLIESATFRLNDSTVAIKCIKDGVAVSRKKALSVRLEA